MKELTLSEIEHYQNQLTLAISNENLDRKEIYTRISNLLKNYKNSETKNLLEIICHIGLGFARVDQLNNFQKAYKLINCIKDYPKIYYYFILVGIGHGFYNEDRSKSRFFFDKAIMYASEAKLHKKYINWAKWFRDSAL